MTHYLKLVIRFVHFREWAKIVARVRSEQSSSRDDRAVFRFVETLTGLEACESNWRRTARQKRSGE